MSSRLQIHLPRFCRACVHRILYGSGMDGPDQIKKITLVMMRTALFQKCAQDPVVYERCSPLPDGHRDLSDMSLVLAEIGCLGCFKPDTRDFLTTRLEIEGLEWLARSIKKRTIPDLDQEDG